MQLLFNDSDENKNIEGLKLINGTVKKLVQKFTSYLF